MANTDAPRGAIPAYHMTGGLIRLDSYPIATGYATSIFTGDFVTLIADGTVTQAAGGGIIAGVFQGVYYTNASGEQVFNKYWPASTTATKIKAMVITDPNVVFLMQHDSVGTTPGGVVDVGGNYDVIVGTGSTLTGVSAMEIDTSTIGTATAQVQVVGIPTHPDNDDDAIWATAYVRVVEHNRLSATGITT